jgi:hypothetical protein
MRFISPGPKAAFSLVTAILRWMGEGRDTVVCWTVLFGDWTDLGQKCHLWAITSAILTSAMHHFGYARIARRMAGAVDNAVERFLLP